MRRRQGFTLVELSMTPALLVISSRPDPLNPGWLHFNSPCDVSIGYTPETFKRLPLNLSIKVVENQLRVWDVRSTRPGRGSSFSDM